MKTVNAANRRQAARLPVAFVIAFQVATAQQYYCRYPSGHPQAGQPYDTLKAHSYSAYIPGNNVQGGSPCYRWIGSLYYPFTMRYHADGYPVMDYWPVAEFRASALQRYYDSQNGGAYASTGETRGYGMYSPANGYSLSYADEDGVYYDCYLFHGNAWASTNDIHADLTMPYYKQAQTHFYGSVGNPMDLPIAPVRFDVRAVTDYQNIDYVTAYTGWGTHTCFPAHVVKATGNSTLYHWMPPQTDPNYIFACLALNANQVQAYPSAVRRVPCQ